MLIGYICLRQCVHWLYLYKIICPAISQDIFLMIVVDDCLCRAYVSRLHIG